MRAQEHMNSDLEAFSAGSWGFRQIHLVCISVTYAFLIEFASSGLACRFTDCGDFVVLTPRFPFHQLRLT